MAEHVYYVCTRATFRPAPPQPACWLDCASDYSLVRDFWSAYAALTPEVWAEAHVQGYTYAAVIEDSAIVALAAAWRYSDEAWELAAVSVDPAHRRRGYGRAVCSFVTAHILEAGRRATCTTGIDNTPMRKTAESIGFYQVFEDLHP